MDLQRQIDEALAGLSCQYAFYYRPCGGEAVLRKNQDIFLSASIIKIPLLFAWVAAERVRMVERRELCDLDLEAPVGGSGLAELLTTRRLPFADVLMLMMAVSDNLCTNLVIHRLTIPFISVLFLRRLGLVDTRLERKLMDYEARGRGMENRVSARDCVRLFDLRDALPPAERAWIDSLLLANTDTGLFLRNVPRDTVKFFHKTGNIEGVLHDWGYTEKVDVFLLTQKVTDEREVYRALDILGPLLLGN
jgi:beta-lactamase class A